MLAAFTGLPHFYCGALMNETWPLPKINYATHVMMYTLHKTCIVNVSCDLGFSLQILKLSCYLLILLYYYA